MKKNLLFVFVLCFYLIGENHAQYTSIPDANFETALLAYDDIPGDHQVPTLSISGLTTLDYKIVNKNINDLTGIEDFTSLVILRCDDNNLVNINVSGLTVLRDLYCGNNELTSLDVTKNTALALLVCYGNNLTSLDLSKNALLTSLNCDGNPSLSCIQVADEDAANNGEAPYTAWAKPSTAVYSEDCQSLLPKTYIPDDDFEQALIDLGYDAGPLNDYVYTIEINSITTLDIAGSDIDIGNIKNLIGIEDFASLEELYCSYNQITELDLSKNNTLKVLECNNNELTSLNVQNGNNSILVAFNATNNSALTCIEVDNEISANSGIGPYTNWQKDLETGYSNNCSLFGITIDVPDDKFEQALIALGYDAILDNLVNASLINEITSLDVKSSYIQDLTGIEGFLSLTYLNCSNNLLESIDLSSNTELAILDCYHNQFTQLDVSSYSSLKILNCTNNQLTNLILNTNLVGLSCQNNQLTELNLSAIENLESLSCRTNPLGSLNLSGNPKLVYLDCYGNQLTNLDLSNNPELRELICGYNQITVLNIGIKENLTILDCRDNQLTSLIVGGAPFLKNLDCHGNNLTNLDVSSNVGLWRLLCYENLLDSLDLSANGEMKSLYCNKNNLTSLNVQNVNNVEFLEFNALNNPALFCIQVDDADKANAKETPYRNWIKDDWTTYSVDCSQPVIVSVGDVIEKLLLELNLDSDGVENGEVSASDIYGVTELNIPSGYSITNLDGIGIFANLETLVVQDKGLTSLDLSNNLALKYLDCSNNLLTSLDLSNNLNLTHIDVSNNPITPGSLILPATYSPTNEAFDPLSDKYSSPANVLVNTTLIYLNISNTDMTSIDISDFESLDTLDVSGSKLDSLDVSANVSLRYLNTTNTTLTCIQVNQDQLGNIPTGWEKEATASYSVDCQAASGIEDELLAASIRMYPNPVNDVLTVESNYRLTKVEIYTIVGGKVKEVYTDFSSIQTGHLSKGIYILKIHSEKGIATKKFTKE